MTTAIEKRLARLEQAKDREAPYVVLASLPDEEAVPYRELSAEEWAARHCGKECK
jgi:hypothetical protein